MARLVSEKEINAVVIPALRDWVKESGVLEFLGKNRVNEYLFLLIGGAGYGYAKKGKSDIDLMLVYDAFEKRGSIDDYKRLHARMHGYVKEKARSLNKELEMARRARMESDYGQALLEEERKGAGLDEGLERERARLAGSVQKARQVVGFDDLSDGLRGYLGLLDVTTGVFRYPDGAKSPALIDLELKLSRAGLRFGELFVKPLWNKKDLLYRLEMARTVPAYTEGLEYGYVWLLPEMLFLLKNGRLVPVSGNGAPERELRSRFILFISLLIKASFLCGFAKKYLRFREVHSEIKRCFRSRDPVRIEYAKALVEEVKSWGRVSYVNYVELEDVIAKEEAEYSKVHFWERWLDGIRHHPGLRRKSI